MFTSLESSQVAEADSSKAPNELLLVQVVRVGDDTQHAGAVTALVDGLAWTSVSDFGEVATVVFREALGIDFDLVPDFFRFFLVLFVSIECI